MEGPFVRKIYTGIDLGSNSIKIVVSEIKNDNYYVLAATSIKSEGIRRGLVVDKELAINSLQTALSDIERRLGVRPNKAIVSVPINGCRLKMISGSITFDNPNTDIAGAHINQVLEDAATTSDKDDDDEIVTITPVVFSVDKKENIKDPKGEKGSCLGVKAVMGTIPKRYLYPLMTVFMECGVEVIDIVFGSIGDYYSASTKEKDKMLGAVINIGEEKIDVSIFNKKILIKNDIIKLGSRNVDNDIIYIYGVDDSKARFLKEKFAYASLHYADKNETIDIQIDDNETKNINQEDITKVVESRVQELLKLSKKQINGLTNRKISYIIVTGGITTMTGFSGVVENEFGLDGCVCENTTMGIRNNKFSTAAGIIKYFNKKMELRDKNYTMFNKSEIDTMMSFGDNISLDNDKVGNIDNYITNN